MPFTLSHAAAALPFRRTGLIFSAVVFGSFSPDFLYFLLFTPHGKFGHTLPGIFLFDLPAAFIMLWLFHAYAKEPLYTWLPTRLRQKISLGPRALPLKSIGQAALLIVSILVGVITHILWDSLTHRDYWPYRHWPLLSYTVQLPVLGPVPYYKLFQNASSVIGLLILLLWFIRWYRATPPAPQQSTPRHSNNERTSLLVTSAVAILAGLIRAWIGISDYSGMERLIRFIAEIVITSMSVFWIELLIYGFLRARRFVNRQS